MSPTKEGQAALELLRDPETLKVLVANDRLGHPHVAIDRTIAPDEEGRIVYQEFLETSARNVALVNSLWFGRPVVIHVEGNGAAYDIRGVPVRCVISGPVFERYYRLALAKDAKADLSGVWLIEPGRTADVALSHQREKESREHPLVMHLDHLAKEQ